ncbi:hypothetical protein BVC93_01575 [Mycobacterium sp. MS1601]|uniref:HAMP domain-containing sensor histidine kinase n=1 Tax=Mycobacterium sp. MS1601 TaxID=1936029 RepID=UPI0009797CF9|nr:HAMP domain-containing sensor histidine kinase [Mycobacterium sp. MS1601]AQA01334.1 hypothetical protein BVC93_01575 [Mycobacterium sp. MS1601]
MDGVSARAFHPTQWGIPARSAAVSAAVMLLALTLAGLGVAFSVLFTSFLSIDGSSKSRVNHIVAELRQEGLAGLDRTLLATNDHVSAVQVIDAGGNVVARSTGAPDEPLASPSLFGPDAPTTIRDDYTPDDNMRLSGQVIDTAAGRFTVMVGGDSNAVEATVIGVAVLMTVAGLLVTIVATLASFLLVRRSLRSVEAIRVRVSEISGSRLDERVPVPVSRDEISALAQTMNAMLARLEASDRAQRQFVGDASHELRSPLTTIISALEVVQAHPQLLDRELALEVVLPEAQRMRVLIEDLLVLARADERGLGLRREWVRLDEVVAAEAGRLAVVSSVAVSTQLVAVSVCGDRDALVRAVRNVCDNAVRYAVSVVELSVGVDVCPDGVTAVVRVGDDGPGVPVADRVRVFDRFVRVGADRSRRGGGAGLGLAIVAEVVSGHGGSVAITDRTAGGTHVTLRLPATAATGNPLP